MAGVKKKTPAHDEPLGGDGVPPGEPQHQGEQPKQHGDEDRSDHDQHVRPIRHESAMKVAGGADIGDQDNRRPEKGPAMGMKGYDDALGVGVTSSPLSCHSLYIPQMFDVAR